MRLFRNLALGAAGLAFLVAVLGSWVRINDAGLTCPDWPLCRGSVIPALRGGVVLEWSHRAGVLLEAFLVVGVLAAGWRIRNAAAGVGRGLGALAAVFAVQVLLGGATVELGNSPISVVLHWAMAMALLGTLTILAVLGFNPKTPAGRVGPPAGERIPATLVAAAAFVYVAMCAGAYVSSSHAGLACASFPLCGAEPFGNSDAQFAQMLHRAAALLVVLAGLAAVVVVSLTENTSRRVRLSAYLGCALVFVQAGLGAANVYAGMPIALRELHAANACLTFIAFVLCATFASLERAPLAAPALQRARSSRIVTSR